MHTATARPKCKKRSHCWLDATAWSHCERDIQEQLNPVSVLINYITSTELVATAKVNFLKHKPLTLQWLQSFVSCLSVKSTTHAYIHIHIRTHKRTLAHTHSNVQTPCKQAEKGRLLTGPRLIRTQFHNFFIDFFLFWEQRKRKMCEDHKKETCKNQTKRDFFFNKKEECQHGKFVRHAIKRPLMTAAMLTTHYKH